MNKLNILICFLLIFLDQIPTKLFGLDVKYCYIKDIVKHESNQKVLKTILEQELASHVSNRDPADQANHLSSRITQIANAMLKNGFLAEAYKVPEFDRNSVVSFNCFALWEGDNNATGSIPLTFFVYVWPSEELALKYNPSEPLNFRYASIIHSHPIPCAFAVLQGALIQNNYEQVSSYSTDRSIRFIDEEIFREGEGDIDDLKKKFIHKLYNRGTYSKVCLSLHAYGLSSSEKVMACFRETLSKCSYEDVRIVFK